VILFGDASLAPEIVWQADFVVSDYWLNLLDIYAFVSASNGNLCIYLLLHKSDSVLSLVLSDAGVGVVDVAVLDPNGQKDPVRPIVARKTDENWYVEYTPLMEGLHSVNIFFAGKAIPSSPYPVAVSTGKSSWWRGHLINNYTQICLTCAMPHTELEN